MDAPGVPPVSPLGRTAAATLLCLALVAAPGHGFAQANNPAATAPASAASAAPKPVPPAAPARIYQQRQKDGSVLFTDRPPSEDTVTERSWSVPAEDAELADKRRERARQEARDDAQAVNERVQRQIERERDRETALALERMRLSQEQARRDAEIARAERERDRAAANNQPPVVIVVPGRQRPPPYAVPGVRPRPPEVRPEPPRPPTLLCGSSKAADCNPGGTGFGSR